MNNTNDLHNLKRIQLKTNELIINWLGQAGFVFKNSQNTILCIDPYYSNSIERLEGRDTRRMWFNKFKIENFKPDAVLCSHDHLDHTDPETIPLLYAYSDAIFYGPESSYKHMKNMRIPASRLKKIIRGKKYNYKNVNFETVLADHTKDSVGFILNFDDIQIYFTGDTSLNNKLYELEKNNIDILISCINGKYGNLNINESIKLAKSLNIKKIIPMHYGLIPSNTSDIYKFINLCQKNNLEPLVLEPEKNYLIKKENNKIDVF